MPYVPDQGSQIETGLFASGLSNGQCIVDAGAFKHGDHDIFITADCSAAWNLLRDLPCGIFQEKAINLWISSESQQKHSPESLPSYMVCSECCSLYPL